MHHARIPCRPRPRRCRRTAYLPAVPVFVSVCVPVSRAMCHVWQARDREYIVREDFMPLLEELLTYHPGRSVIAPHCSALRNRLALQPTSLLRL